VDRIDSADEGAQLAGALPRLSLRLASARRESFT
jgi:hypothetical protein